MEPRCPNCQNPIALTERDADEACCTACGSSFKIRDVAPTVAFQTQVHGKFQLLDRIGTGGFGAVWKAKDVGLGRIVAVKVLHPSLVSATSDRERFLREARAAAQLRHPHIVSVHEIVEIEGAPAIVSDFIQGMTLRELLEVRRLTFRESAELVAQIADALDYAHSMKLVHRDVKPANIMIEYGPGQGPNTSLDRADQTGLQSGVSSGVSHSSTLSSRPITPRGLLLDFGLALRDELEVTLTADGQVIGTPAYMSPEQASGKGHRVDRRSDIYSLGVVLYELISGEIPFRGSKIAMIQQVLSEEPKPPRRINDRIPRDLETICLKSMSKLSAARYGSAREVADDLRRFLIGEPILARPASTVERAWRWCRRNPALAALSGSVLALLVIVAVGSTWAAISIDAKRRAAEDAEKRASLKAEEARKAQLAEQAARVQADANAAAARAAQIDAETARQLADDNAVAAVQQSELALESLKTLVEQLQQHLRGRPDLLLVRRDMLESTLLRLLSMVAGGQTSSAARRAVMSAHLQAAEVAALLAKDKEAAEHYQQGFDIARVLFQETPEDTKARGNFALATSKMATLALQRGDLATARQMFHEAFTLQEELLKRPKSAAWNPEVARPNLATYCIGLGRVSEAGGQYEQARDWYQRALLLREQVALLDPTNLEPQQRLAETHSSLGDVSFSLRDTDAMRRHFARAIESFDTLRKAKSSSIPFQQQYAQACDRLGDKLLFLHDPRPAAESYQRALEIYARLAEQFPTDDGTQNSVGFSHYRLGTAFLESNDRAQAGAHYNSALTIRETLLAKTPPSLGRQSQVMVTRARCGKHAAAATMAQALRAAQPKSANWQFQVACCLAQCSAAATDPSADPAPSNAAELSNVYAEQAVAALGVALDNGFKDVAGLASDPDLAPLRERPDFQTLVARLKPE